MGYFSDKLSAAFPAAAPYIERLQGQGVGATFVRGAGGAFAVNVVGTGCLFLTYVVLARALGASSYGNYAYAYTWLTILALFGKLGLDIAALRFVAEYKSTQKWALLKGFVKRSSQISIIISAVVALITSAVVWMARDRMDQELVSAFEVMCLVLPFFAVLQVRSSALRGLQNVVASQSSVKILPPLLLLSGVGILYFLTRDRVNASTAMAVNLVAFACSILFVEVFLKKNFPREARSVKPESRAGAWTKVAAPMLLMGVMAQTQSQMDVLVSGIFLDSVQIGIYDAAKKITLLIVFGLVAVNIVVAPMVAELWHQGKIKELQRMLTLAAWGIFAFTLPVSLVIIIFGKKILSLFGPEFTAGYWPLVILSVGQIVNSLAGSVGIIMNMTGHHNRLVFIVAFSMVVDIILSFLLIPALSLIGAALAISLTVITWNVLMYVYVVKKLRLEPSVFGIIKFYRA